MNLRDLEYLVAVADHRHFGRAADACHVSQPTLSTQLKKLETELGVDLVERARQVVLTEPGERVVERARAILADVDAVRGIARQASDPRAGTLRLGAFPTIAPYLLPHVVPHLRHEFADLELHLVEEKTPVLLDRLGAGRIDAAVLAMPVPDESLHVEPLFREDFVLAVPAGHHLAGLPEPLPLSALTGERMLLLDDGHCLRDHALSVCRLAGIREQPGFRATSLETLRYMVAAGAGVTLLPRMAVEPPVAASESIVLKAFQAPAPAREIALVWRRSSVRAPLLAEVAAVLRRVPADLVTPLPG